MKKTASYYALKIGSFAGPAVGLGLVAAVLLYEPWTTLINHALATAFNTFSAGLLLIMPYILLALMAGMAVTVAWMAGRIMWEKAESIN